MPYILPVLRLDNHRSVSTGFDPLRSRVWLPTTYKELRFRLEPGVGTDQLIRISVL